MVRKYSYPTQKVFPIVSVRRIWLPHKWVNLFLFFVYHVHAISLWRSHVSIKLQLSSVFFFYIISRYLVSNG